MVWEEQWAVPALGQAETLPQDHHPRKVSIWICNLSQQDQDGNRMIDVTLKFTFTIIFKCCFNIVHTINFGKHVIS